MKKNKLEKKDYFLMGTLAILFVIFVSIVLRGRYSYGSTMDWESQHSVIPEYFRLLFYNTHDLFPDFAFNLGNGQNIFNFAYYGLLSPIILISYVLPFIRMTDFIAIASMFSVIMSSLLFYVWLRKNNDKGHLTSFLGAFVLMFASSMTFHSHRHVMFMNYMPFMILGLFGVDKKLTTGKGWLLSLSIFGMIMTSFYYSVGGIITLVIYGVYKWMSLTDKLSLKKFVKDGCKFALPIVLGVGLGAVLLLPTFHVILSSRGATFNTITWKDLFIPGINIGYFMYNTYGIGLTSISVVAIVNLLFKKREKRMLGVILASMLVFPFLNYLLNATMYIDAKALIPVLPLATYAISLLIDDMLERRIKLTKLAVPLGVVVLGVVLRGEWLVAFFSDLLILTVFTFLYWKFDKRILLIIPIAFIPFVTSLTSSFQDEYVSKKRANEVYENLNETISSITEADDQFYRISNAKTILRDVNNLYGNIDYYTSTLYSSTYNMGYNRFYYDIIENPIQNRNRVITSPTSNILFLMFSGNKYLIDNRANYMGYEYVREVGGNKIYSNEDVFPVIYARNEVLNKADFDKLSSIDKSISLLKSVVVDGKGNYEYTSDLERVDIDIEDFDFGDLNVDQDRGDYVFEATNNSKIVYNIPIKYRDKILFVRFKMKESASCSSGDTSITIDGVKNKLTCRSWKYHNQNYDFAYTLANKDREKYEITFEKGPFRISDIEVYALNYDNIANERKKLDEFSFDKNKTKGDFIVGNIDVSKDGYVVTSIPYDEGFVIKVDGEQIDYVRVDEAFVGFQVTQGQHEVEIEYKAPFKKEGLILSSISFLGFAIATFVERKKTTL